MTAPVEELRSAAVLLRQRATDATKGPWTMADLTGPGVTTREWHVLGPEVDLVTPIPVETHTDDPREYARAEADVTYVATVHPLVGLALADLLDRFASMYETGAWVAAEFRVEHSAIQSPVEPQALALARLILGGGS